MGLLSFFRQKPKGLEFDDNDRAMSLEVRRAKRDLLQTRQQLEVERTRLEIEKIRAEIDEIRGQFEDDEDEPEQSATSPESMLSGILMAAMANKQQQQPPAPVAQAIPPAELTDEEIKRLIDSFPKHQVKLFRSLPDDTKINLIRSKMPNLGQDTINRALQMLNA